MTEQSEFIVIGAGLPGLAPRRGHWPSGVVAWCGGRSLPVDGIVTGIGLAAAAGTRLPRAVLARQVQLTPLARFS